MSVWTRKHAPRTGLLQRLAAVATVVLLVASCGGGGGGEERDTAPAPAGEREMGTLTLRIINNNFNAATVYALWPASRRLGRVEGKTEQVLTVQINGPSVTFEGRLQGGSPARIGPIAATPNTEYQLVIPPGM